MRRRQEGITRKSVLYDAPRSREEIECFQASRFNVRWGECLALPFYRRWADEHDLPPFIEHPSELAAWPLLTKDVLVERERQAFADGGRLAFSTGGSTGRPARYPRGKGDTDWFYANMYTARAWWGVRPFDPQIAIWGHAHLFGTGLKSKLRVVQRRIADRTLNMVRLDAYDMRPETLQAHAETIARSNPTFIYGYTSAVFKVGSILRAKHPDYAAPNLRAVAVSAETATDADIDVIASGFRAPVSIEYGTAETGVIAASRGTTREIQVLWDAHIALADDVGNLALTTLDSRRFPLVNYAVGDVVVPLDELRGNCLAFRAVIGRQKDVLALRSRAGAPIEVSAILPVHILKSYPGITGVQFRRFPDAARVYIEADRPVDLNDVAAYFREQFAKDYPDIDARTSFAFERDDSPQLTIAGKHRLFRE